MNYLNPIHTEKRQCQDCYKCVRNCPVKAIKIEAGCATVIPDLCILCGHCVAVCPNSAKRIRDDLPRCRHLLTLRKRVIVSLAPSFVAEFPGLRPGQLVAALKRLGFWGVSETALGAQQVSAHVATMLHEKKGAAMISSACPVVVQYIQKHHSSAAPMLTGLLSPLLAHCKMLRGTMGDDIGIVFIGPCIAKKSEADTNQQLLDVALTFRDLRQWFEQERIDPAAMQETAEDCFVPERAHDGAIYPIDGGMAAGIKAGCTIHDCAFMSFSGLSSIQKALGGIENLHLDQSMLIEALACEGGCINGPAVSREDSTIAKRCQVLQYGQYDAAQIPRKPELMIDVDLRATPAPAVQYSDMQIRQALRTVGKFSADDELNCGGCGYDSCRQFGAALLDSKAERTMCVTYMRQLAAKKANALIQKMPSAVVIVDQDLKIVECNAAFARLFAGASGKPIDEIPATLEGTPLGKLVPFQNLFSGVLRTGQDIVDKDIRYRDTILHLSIFTIEKHCVVGGIIQDITKPAVQKEQVIRKAQEVIQRNLATVQQIAYLLGENAAESETTLNSIIDSFSVSDIDKIDDPGAQGSDWRKRY